MTLRLSLAGGGGKITFPRQKRFYAVPILYLAQKCCQVSEGGQHLAGAGVPSPDLGEARLWVWGLAPVPPSLALLFCQQPYKQPNAILINEAKSVDVCLHCQQPRILTDFESLGGEQKFRKAEAGLSSPPE